MPVKARREEEDVEEEENETEEGGEEDSGEVDLGMQEKKAAGLFFLIFTNVSV